MTDVEALRDQIRREVSEWETFTADDGYRAIRKRDDRSPDQIADAVLALPAFRDVLAAATRDAKAVKRVRELVAFYDRHEYSSLEVDDLRRALDGPAEPPQDAPGGAGARMDGSDVAGTPGATGEDR